MEVSGALGTRRKLSSQRRKPQSEFEAVLPVARGLHRAGHSPRTNWKVSAATGGAGERRAVSVKPPWCGWTSCLRRSRFVSCWSPFLQERVSMASMFRRDGEELSGEQSVCGGRVVGRAWAGRGVGGGSRWFGGDAGLAILGWRGRGGGHGHPQQRRLRRGERGVVWRGRRLRRRRLLPGRLQPRAGIRGERDERRLG